MLPGFNGFVPLVGISGFKDRTQTILGRQRKYLGEYVLSDKCATFVHVVVFDCGRYKVTTKGAFAPNFFK
jgi:hypothetical protein